jgi:hypothetical protein
MAAFENGMVCLSQVEGNLILIADRSVTAPFSSRMRHARPPAIDDHHNPVDPTACGLFILQCSNYLMMVDSSAQESASGVSR